MIHTARGFLARILAQMIMCILALTTLDGCSSDSETGVSQSNDPPEIVLSLASDCVPADSFFRLA